MLFNWKSANNDDNPTTASRIFSRRLSEMNIHQRILGVDNKSRLKCLITFKCDIDHQPKKINNVFCTSSCWAQHLSQVWLYSLKGCGIYGSEKKRRLKHTEKCDLDLVLKWLMPQSYRHSKQDIWAKFCDILQRLSESWIGQGTGTQARNDGQTDRRMGGHTDWREGWHAGRQSDRRAKGILYTPSLFAVTDKNLFI